MTEPTLSNFFAYFSIVWGSNILLNFLYVVKRYIPKTKKFDRPIDFGKRWGRDRIIGESTTFFGLILSIIVSILLYLFTHSFVWSSIPLLVYLGHTMGSVIKRRMHKKDGEFVPVVDHGDYVVFSGSIFFIFDIITFKFFIFSLLLTYILHPIACFIAFRLKLREYPY